MAEALHLPQLRRRPVHGAQARIAVGEAAPAEAVVGQALPAGERATPAAECALTIGEVTLPELPVSETAALIIEDARARLIAALRIAEAVARNIQPLGVRVLTLVLALRSEVRPAL